MGIHSLVKLTQFCHNLCLPSHCQTLNLFPSLLLSAVISVQNHCSPSLPRSRPRSSSSEVSLLLLSTPYHIQLFSVLFIRLPPPPVSGLHWGFSIPLNAFTASFKFHDVAMGSNRPKLLTFFIFIVHMSINSKILYNKLFLCSDNNLV